MVSRPTVDPVIQPGDIETLALYYLQPVLSPTPCATRLPQPNNQSDTINGFLRVEAAGGGKANYLEYDLNLILHAYSPVEMQAANIAQTAMAFMTAARGQTVAGWFVGLVKNTVMPHRLTDPNINLVRYRAAVTWRVAGQPLYGS